MAASRIVFLMYHELELASRKLCQSEPGYVRYILPLETFRVQMAWMKKSGWRGLNVAEALRYPAQPSVCITFADGCETLSPLRPYSASSASTQPSTSPLDSWARPVISIPARCAILTRRVSRSAAIR